MYENKDNLISKHDINVKINKTKKVKSDLGDNFVAPDGGYAWVVCIAAGLSNLCLFTPVQSFGLIFHDKFKELGITGAQTTTILNCQTAIRSCSGVLNGPLLRTFSYRQVGLAGSLLITVGIFSLSFASSFIEFIICYSIVFALGVGVCRSSTSIVVNTYFKLNRRRARSYQLVLTSLGPIVLPYLVNYMLDNYDVQGTLMCFSGICLHCFGFALFYQPVKWHVKKTKTSTYSCDNCSKLDNNHQSSIELKIINSNCSADKNDTNTSDIKCEKCAEKESMMKKNTNTEKSKTEEEYDDKLKWYHIIIKFFDLDLLNDFTFLNILIGITLSNFGEHNSHVLRPFYFREFGYTRDQIAVIMSSQGASDIIVRFFIPFCTKKINWANRTYFLFSILGLIVVRTLLSLNFPFEIIVGLSILAGALRAFRVLFLGLIIPDYVPLKKLPAADGLQLAIGGLLTLSCGPFVGLIKDHTNYSFALNILNIFSTVTIILWTVEIVYIKWNEKSKN